MKGDVRVLTSWEPSTYDRATIRHEFYKLLRKLGVSEWNYSREGGVEVRTPVDHRRFEGDSIAMRWHHDGSAFAGGIDRYIICWSNHMPTQIRDLAGSELQLQPYDVVMFDNRAVEHCAPAGVNHTDTERWFVRVFLTKDETTTKLLKGES